MTKSELVNLVAKQKSLISESTLKQEQSEEQVNRMRHDYLKELSNLREQVVSKDLKGKKFEYLDVYYFEPTDSLN